MNNFLVTFGFMGLLFLPIIILFLVGGVDLKHKLGGFFVCLAFWVVFAGGISIQSNHNKDLWNNGYCECGTHWELRAANKTKNGSETKYYSCPECHNEIQLNW